MLTLFIGRSICLTFTPQVIIVQKQWIEIMFIMITTIYMEGLSVHSIMDQRHNYILKNHFPL